MFKGDSTNRFEVIHKEGTLSGCKIYRDKVTGVHYLFSWDGYAGGLTPLLDSNGNPVVKANSK
ncbi:DUF6440 family protein [Caldibacillus lycopersici]|uniref:DUF6440 family protein n=1 Tax=Perspicuibacillus lycopersici TaxID=1325689 RepID=A0AAE3IU92_9BACI|nr:DUF6440 family protein [Perspicuibacillus lycopersici]MCU9613536.1 DUF6440 family protein [Perspicuibacillus lycopersici]